MANEMPNPEHYSGLTRTALQYSSEFEQLLRKAKAAPLTDADWQPLEALVDTATFVRQGVFLGAKAQITGWDEYRAFITQYGGYASWEGTLRHATETPGRVILELEERNTLNGVTDVSNTVVISEFNEAGKVRHLDIYVMPLDR